MIRKLWSSLGRVLNSSASVTEGLSDEDFVRVCYEIILGRKPDRQGFFSHVKALKDGVPREQIVRRFLDSPELERRLEERNPLEALHSARMKFIRSLPPADYILDLGGAARDCEDGALYAMGYPHPSKRVYIVDLPPESRVEKPTYETRKIVKTERTTVEYVFSSMSDLSVIESNSIDLVFSGESIEHISEQDAEHTIRETHRVLKNGGYFCLDTPNGRLTRIQSPDAFIHPEHKKEYRFDELKNKLITAGFAIEEFGGICPMRESARSGIFDEKEMVRNPVVDSDPEVCYLLFFKCKKPPA